MTTILVVDDEPRIRDIVQYTLSKEGFEVLLASNGNEALGLLKSKDIDLVVLDVLMPDLDGLSVCRTLRTFSDVPCIFLSSRGEEVDRILGLELGGDDYLTKPFSPRELATRIRTVLRRTARTESNKETLVHGPIELDLVRHEVRVKGDRINLTVTEFAVLQALLERPGRLLTRSQLIDRAYIHDNHITERTMDTHIRRIRAKMRPLGVDPIETVHGLGYKAGEIENP